MSGSSVRFGVDADGVSRYQEGLDLALTRAAHQGDIKELRRAIKAGASPRAGAEVGAMTALMLAAKNGRLECLLELLPLSDPNARDRHGGTALMLACEHGISTGQIGTLECVKALLPVSDPNMMCHSGFTALMHACYSARTGETEERAMEFAHLLAPVTDVGIRDKQGKSALILALENGNPNLSTLMLSRSDLLSVNEAGVRLGDQARRVYGETTVALHGLRLKDGALSESLDLRIMAMMEALELRASVGAGKDLKAGPRL